MTQPQRLVARSQDEGVRLDVFLADHLHVSRARAQKAIAADGVRVDGRARAKHHVVQAGEVVEVDLTVVAEPAMPLQPESLAVPVIYEDVDLLVIDKPAGLVVHPAPGHERGTLVNALLERGIGGGHGSRPGIVHRLDRDTSGLMVVARHEAAYQRLVAAMAQRRIERIYTALVYGGPPEDAGCIDAPIGRHIRDRKRMSLHTTAPRRAVTHFRVLARFADMSLLDVTLETGRTHQIRVHVAALGFPVVGDVVYGRRPRPSGLSRQFLHARKLSLPHPMDPERRLTFEAPLPPDLASFLAGLR